MKVQNHRLHFVSRIDVGQDDQLWEWKPEINFNENKIIFETNKSCYLYYNRPNLMVESKHKCMNYE
jgi:hypothetical protein